MPAYYPKTDFRTVWGLIWPQTLMMMMQFGIAFVCVWVAGHIDPVVQASFGMVAQCTMFLLVVAIAMSSGAIACISQSLGAGLAPRARRYALLVGWGSLLLGILTALLGYAFRSQLFDALMAPPETRVILDNYWLVTSLTIPLNYIWGVSSGLFRAIRRVIAPLVITMLVFAVIVFGATGLGLGWFGLPDCGYMGIAWANFVSVLIGAAGNILLLLRLGYLRPRDTPPWRWIRRGAPYLVRVAWPAGLSQFLWQLGYLVIFAITASLPRESVAALAGMTAGMRVESLLFMPAFAFNMTVSVLVGNSLGAGDKAEARRIALVLSASGCVFISSLAGLMWPFMDDLATLLSASPAVREQTVSYLFYNLLAAPFTAGSMILGGVMMGAGATRYNLAVFASSFWLVRLPLAWLFGHVLWGDAAGIFLSMLVSQAVQASMILWVLLRLDWTRFSLRRSGPLTA
ncbi:MAG: MATE family efflux transporter [Deltaproteobacteria bacterium]|jgi:MATE family multidrug resistance protein|nr:MATE family efflux transporter [Deltaproteobacteria bacterium]